jgi:hypothetical protein
LLFEETIGEALGGADMLTQNLQRERNAFSELNNDLQSQTETAATTLNRQVRLLREATKVVKTELGDAERALEMHFTAFRATAVQVAEGAEQLTRAAQAAGAASSGLDATLSGALGSLAQADELTDAARRSTQTVVQAANVTANSVREATQRAIGDAKAVADLIRKETQAMHATASAALVAMRETADAVRLYSPFSRISGERKDAASVARPTVAAAAQEAPCSLHEIAASIAQNQVDRMRLGGRFTWTNLLPKPANDGAPAPAAGELVSFPPPKDNAVARRALDLVASAGVSVGETLSARDLDAVAAASRKGVTARRKAVLDAAPIEVTRIARLLRRDDDAKDTALAFRKRSDLAQVRNAKRSTASGDLMRAYLLVDAALG